MVPNDTPAGLKGHELIIVEVTPTSWTAHNGDYKLTCTYSPHTSVTDRLVPGQHIGWVTDGHVWFSDTSIFMDALGVVSTTGLCRQTAVSVPEVKSASLPRDKPYLAMNEAPWRKRKKGRSHSR